MTKDLNEIKIGLKRDLESFLASADQHEAKLQQKRQKLMQEINELESKKTNLEKDIISIKASKESLISASALEQNRKTTLPCQQILTLNLSGERTIQVSRKLLTNSFPKWQTTFATMLT